MSKFKIGVKVMPREVILDTQGRAIEQSLRLNNMAVETARVGRFVELEIQANTEQEAMSKAQEISKKLLCNSLIENFEMIKL
jgi:phosphoribosylformylglycinamidine synthase PurS subunit